MNTRGLTELIVLNLALEAGVISEALFAALVLMALVTTFMAGPLLRLLDPKNTFGAPVEEELDEARAESQAEFPALEVPERSILVAPQADEGLERLGGLARALAGSDPPRELILARLVRPPRGLRACAAACRRRTACWRRPRPRSPEARNELIADGIAARSVAFISADPGADLARLADREEVDLLLTDGARPLLGEGVPRGAVGKMLEEAPSDVAVLVAREDVPVQPGPDAPVIVPFGGVEHDWAALELGAWIASATGAPLKLLGAAGSTDEGRRHQGLADARRRRPARAAVLGRALRARGGRARARRASSRRPPAPACWWSACPSAGATRASGRRGRRSPAQPPPPSCSCAAAPAPARSPRATT